MSRFLSQGATYTLGMLLYTIDPDDPNPNQRELHVPIDPELTDAGRAYVAQDLHGQLPTNPDYALLNTIGDAVWGEKDEDARHAIAQALRGEHPTYDAGEWYMLRKTPFASDTAAVLHF